MRPSRRPVPRDPAARWARRVAARSNALVSPSGREQNLVFHSLLLRRTASRESDTLQRTLRKRLPCSTTGASALCDRSSMRKSARTLAVVLAVLSSAVLGIVSAFMAAFAVGAATALIVPGTGTPNANIVQNYM